MRPRYATAMTALSLCFALALAAEPVERLAIVDQAITPRFVADEMKPVSKVLFKNVEVRPLR